MKILFKDRSDAGQLLAKRLEKFKGKDAVVVAIPRGGVPVACPIATRLNLPLEVILTKKIGHPKNKEFAIGAVSLNDIILDEHKEVSSIYIDEEASLLRQEIKRAQELYSGTKEPASLKNRTVILIDDGIATGKTILLAVRMLRTRQPEAIILAVPILPHNMVKEIARHVDEFIYIVAPHDFNGVSNFYEKFDQVSDEEVILYLRNTLNNAGLALNS